MLYFVEIIIYRKHTEIWIFKVEKILDKSILFFNLFYLIYLILKQYYIIYYNII